MNVTKLFALSNVQKQNAAAGQEDKVVNVFFSKTCTDVGPVMVSDEGSGRILKWHTFNNISLLYP